MADLLLHSLAEFREVIFACLDACRPASIVEIGAEKGEFTKELVGWAKKFDATVVAIDPAPADALLELAAEESAVLTVDRRLSHAALVDLPPAEAYFVDGDHNYATVEHELRLIFDRADTSRVIVFLHDVGWPCARRDQYYDPSRVPSGGVRAYDYERGVRPDDPGMVDIGFNGAGNFAFAVEEGGARNGVLTAVEDFLAEHPELRFARVPAVFGLGVMYSAAAPSAESVRSVLAPLDEHPLIARLEENRLALYIHVLELQAASARAAEVDGELRSVIASVSGHRDHLQSELERQSSDLHRTKRDLDQAVLRLREVDADNKALWRRVHELEAERDAARQDATATRGAAEELAALADEVARSRAFQLAHRGSQVKSWISGTTGLSPARIREAVDRFRSR